MDMNKEHQAVNRSNGHKVDSNLGAAAKRINWPSNMDGSRQYNDLRVLMRSIKAFASYGPSEGFLVSYSVIFCEQCWLLWTICWAT